MRRSFFELNQEAHAQREPRCRDVIRWSKCSVAVLVFASRSARAWGIAADVHLRIRIFIRLPFRSARHQWGQRGRDIAVPTIEISRIVPARTRIAMTRDDVWRPRQFRPEEGLAGKGCDSQG